VPALLHSLPKDQPANRLTLAKWLVSPDNPLTARVTVNRYWEQVLGLPLMESPDDFGIRGKAPTHPELLDWLAVEFSTTMQWDVRKLLKLMVTSAAYRQASTVTPALIERDAENRWLARGLRFRSPAAHQHAAATARYAQRSRLRRGGATARPRRRQGRRRHAGGEVAIWLSPVLDSAAARRRVEEAERALHEGASKICQGPEARHAN